MSSGPGARPPRAAARCGRGRAWCARWRLATRPWRGWWPARRSWPCWPGRPATRAGARADPEGARSQLSFDLTEVIAAAAARRPVLVVIDDAHQADTSSLRLLAELAPALRAMSAAVLVTARDGDQAWHGRLDERSALLRSGLVITLPPFTESEIAGLVAGVTGAPPAPTWSASSPSAAAATPCW